MSTLPQWARKPNHKKEVIATNLGWTVESTGEVLKRVYNLTDKLEELLGEAKDAAQSIQDKSEPEVVDDETEKETEKETEEKKEVEPPKKKRGRPAASDKK